MFLQLFLLSSLFFYLDYIGAEVQPCALSFRTIVPAAPDRAELTPQPPPPPLHLWSGRPLGMAQAYSLPSAAEGRDRWPQCGGCLASESKFQGINNEYDCSNYQLFKLCFWDMFYKTR